MSDLPESRRHVPETRSDTSSATFLTIAFDFAPVALVARMRFGSLVGRNLLSGSPVDRIHNKLHGQIAIVHAVVET